MDTKTEATTAAKVITWAVAIMFFTGPCIAGAIAGITNIPYPHTLTWVIGGAIAATILMTLISVLTIAIRKEPNHE